MFRLPTNPVAGDEIKTRVLIELAQAGQVSRRVDVGTYDGSCNEQSWRTYERPAPDAAPVGGTICYIGGATIVVLTRAAEHLVVNVASQSDGAMPDPNTGELVSPPTSPWNVVKRIPVGVGTQVRLKGFAMTHVGRSGF
jgi:hypothetical protein